MRQSDRGCSRAALAPGAGRSRRPGARSPAPPAAVTQRSAAELVAATIEAASSASSAVRKRGVLAPDASDSLVARDETATGQVDVDGLPLVYDREAIQSFWDARPGELQSRWTEFLGLNAPLLTKLVGLLLSGGPGAVAARAGELAGDARRIMEKLGPTYVKIGQLLSARPDIIGQEATTELSKLQDSVARFDSPTALAVIEAELGRPLFEVFAELGDEPVAAASLAQVYRGRLVSGEEVAVKVQRPGIRGVVSKDLYVLRRAAEVYQSIMDRLTPSQNTDYVALMSEFAIGLYTELDFSNEASNAITMRKLLADAAVPGVYVPRVFEQLGSRRLLVMEWVSGRKLSSCSPGEIRALTPVAQEAFLMQLLTWGFVHADPHPGNLLALDDTSGGYSLALLDFGLMARLTLQDREALVSSVVHLANESYDLLIDDFIALRILPADTPRATVQGLMAKVLRPYVRGGGGLQGAVKAYGGRSGIQQLTSDLIGALASVSFSIPSYFALLARAVAVLEGVALQGDPDYRIVLSSYPHVARKLMGSDSPALARALAEILYAPGAGGGGGSGGGGSGGGGRELRASRLVALLSAALGNVATSDAFVDFDAAAALSPAAALRLLLSPAGAGLREGPLYTEALAAAELLARRALRRAAAPLLAAAADSPLLRLLPPFLPQPAVWLPAPGGGAGAGAWLPPAAALDALAPPLTRPEELYAQSLSDGLAAAGLDADALAQGWAPLTLLPGGGGGAGADGAAAPPPWPLSLLPRPALSPLPAGVSAAALAALPGLGARAAREARLPGAASAQAASAVSAARGALLAAYGAGRGPGEGGHDDAAELVDALAGLDPDQAQALAALLTRLGAGLAARVTARMDAASAVAVAR